MSHTVLIVEDDKRIASWVTRYFNRAGFSAEVAHDGHTGLELARSMVPDLILLDLMLPGLDGMTLCRRLRRESDVPIIMLTAKGAQPDRIQGLDGGADDYVVKPFDPDELVARAKAVLRRYEGRVQWTLTCGPLVMDEATRQVSVDQQPVELSEAQFQLLAALLRHPNRVLSRRQLIDLALGRDFDGYDRAIDSHIVRLRRAIHREDFQPIQTVYGAGYRLACKDV